VATVVLTDDMPTEMINPNFVCRRLLYQSQKSNQKREDLDAAS
jgi:hypothetical protein